MRRKAIKDFIRRRPKEASGTVIGAVAGAPIGLAIGGVGLAAMGGAIGVPAVVVCSVLGADIGNRIGVGLDRPLKDQRQVSRNGEMNDRS